VDSDDIQPLPLEVVYRCVECDAPPAPPRRLAARRRASSMRTSRARSSPFRARPRMTVTPCGVSATIPSVTTTQGSAGIYRGTS
jgi:hypothetical protein